MNNEGGDAGFADVTAAEPGMDPVLAFLLSLDGLIDRQKETLNGMDWSAPRLQLQWALWASTTLLVDHAVPAVCWRICASVNLPVRLRIEGLVSVAQCRAEAKWMLTQTEGLRASSEGVAAQLPTDLWGAPHTAALPILMIGAPAELRTAILLRLLQDTAAWYGENHVSNRLGFHLVRIYGTFWGFYPGPED